jgi:hypothetical protein
LLATIIADQYQGSARFPSFSSFTRVFVIVSHNRHDFHFPFFSESYLPPSSMLVFCGSLCVATNESAADSRLFLETDLFLSMTILPTRDFRLSESHATATAAFIFSTKLNSFVLDADFPFSATFVPDGSAAFFCPPPLLEPISHK